MYAYLLANGDDKLLGFKGVVGFVLEVHSDYSFAFAMDKIFPVAEDCFVGFAHHALWILILFKYLCKNQRAYIQKEDFFVRLFKDW